MDIVEEMQRGQKETTHNLRENFMHQLLAFRACGGRTVKTLKEGTVQAGVCSDVFNISDAINELVQEGKVTIEFIGGDPYLWLKNRS